MNFAVWRHPQARGVGGRCVGQIDLPVDRRKSKRLAHRIRRWARVHDAARLVVTSPLRRAADVGGWLARWGWTHRVDARLCELHFGAWDGRCWDEIGAEAVQAWCFDFAAHAPGGGESVAQLMQRAEDFLHSTPCCVVGHAGWISAALWSDAHDEAPCAAQWPSAVRCNSLTLLRQRG